MNLHERALLLNKTDRELAEIHKLYDENFEKLAKCKHASIHKALLKIENRLNDRGINRQKKLGILIPDPNSKYGKKCKKGNKI